MRRTLLRDEVNALMTRQLRAIAGCEGSSVRAGPLVPDANPEPCNWLGFGCTPAPGARSEHVWLIAGGVVSQTRELYNIVERC